MRSVGEWQCDLHPLGADEAARRILGYLFARKQYDDEDIRELANALQAWRNDQVFQATTSDIRPPCDHPRGEQAHDKDSAGQVIARAQPLLKSAGSPFSREASHGE